MLKTDALDYELPEELIATEPVSPRDAARLMVVPREGGANRHLVFRDLVSVLRAGDLLVVNSSKVMPARFLCEREDTGGRGEGLYLGCRTGEGGVLWECLFKMRRARAGTRMRLLDHHGAPSDVALELVERDGDEGGWLARAVERTGGNRRQGPQKDRRGTEEPPEDWRGTQTDPRQVLARVGMTPVPPYIVAARKKMHVEVDDQVDQREYQTVYAHDAGTGTPKELHGSIAAPTAGLHFTPELLERLSAMGVERAEVMLDVGMGTFKPVETETVEEHPMHSEFCCVPRETAEAVARCRASGGRVIAVGTTAARTLESFESVEDLRTRGPGGVHTRLLITPGWKWRLVDGLITNFHLPRTTLLAMVAGMMEGEAGGRRGAGGESDESVARLLEVYREAVRERYRFYSYGDAMVVV